MTSIYEDMELLSSAIRVKIFPHCGEVGTEESLPFYILRYHTAKEGCEALALWTQTVCVSGNYFHTNIRAHSAWCPNVAGATCRYPGQCLLDTPMRRAMRTLLSQDVPQKYTPDAGAEPAALLRDSLCTPPFPHLE